jgi:hypothetical protein
MTRDFALAVQPAQQASDAPREGECGLGRRTTAAPRSPRSPAEPQGQFDDLKLCVYACTGAWSRLPVTLGSSGVMYTGTVAPEEPTVATFPTLVITPGVVAVVRQCDHHPVAGPDARLLGGV